MAFKPDGWEMHMTILSIETFVCRVDNVPESVRLFKDDEPERSFESIAPEQVPVEAAMAMGHD